MSIIFNSHFRFTILKDWFLRYELWSHHSFNHELYILEQWKIVISIHEKKNIFSFFDWRNLNYFIYIEVKKDNIVFNLIIDVWISIIVFDLLKLID